MKKLPASHKEVVDCEAYPAGSEYEDCCDDFSDKADWLAEDVEDCEY